MSQQKESITSWMLMVDFGWAKNTMHIELLSYVICPIFSITFHHVPSLSITVHPFPTFSQLFPSIFPCFSNIVSNGMRPSTKLKQGTRLGPLRPPSTVPSCALELKTAKRMGVVSLNTSCQPQNHVNHVKHITYIYIIIYIYIFMYMYMYIYLNIYIYICILRMSF